MRASPVWQQRIDWLLRLLERHTKLLALFGFVSGLASFFLIERKDSLARVVALVMLVSWLWLMLENPLRRLLGRFGLRLPPGLVRYATQMVHQESLFFVLPFFAVTTTWNSGQAAFTGLLGVAALVSIVDPLYYRQLAARPLLYMLFHSLTLFAVLLTAFPLIVHLSTEQSYRWALGVAVVLSLPSLFGALRQPGWRRWAGGLVLTLALGVAGWQGRLWVPPATLWLTDVSISDSFDALRRSPGESLHSLSQAQLRSQGLYAYTAIKVPRGLKERIFHVWQRDGGPAERIALNISGGREAGYRAWSHKQNFPAEVVGKWQVRVETEAGQMIGVLRFEVTP